MLPVALIIAGGSGMGAASARALAADGFAVAVMSPSGKGEALGKELGGIGFTGSNQSIADLTQLKDLVMATWGRIDVLVNSAGHSPAGALLDITDEDWAAGFNTYFMNVVRAVRLVAPVMIAQGKGSIINITSAWTFEPSTDFPTSGVARAALAGYTKLFADSYGKDGLRMNNVLPGWIHTHQFFEERRRAVPLQRYGSAEEVAATVAFLASEKASYITGQNLRVDGGLMHSLH